MDDDETREIEDLLTKPFGEVDLSGAFRGPTADGQGGPRNRADRAATPRPTRAERSAHRKRLKQWRRKAFADGLLDSDILQADFLLFKQLLYFERYGKMYLSDVALLGDREYLEAVLALPLRETAKK